MRLLAGRNRPIARIDGFENHPIAVDMIPTVFTADGHEQAFRRDVNGPDLRVVCPCDPVVSVLRKPFRSRKNQHRLNMQATGILLGGQ